jgi:hypothetical protein
MTGFKQRPILYISGPFSAKDPIHGIEQNILTASKYALEAWEKGWGVICPHKNTQGFQHTNLPYDVWIQGDLAIIDRMSREKGDALFMLPGWQDSQGAVLERNFAFQKGLKIFYCVKEGKGIPEAV